MVNNEIRQVIVEVRGNSSTVLTSRIQSKVNEMNSQGYELTNLLRGKVESGRGDGKIIKESAILIFTRK